MPQKYIKRKTKPVATYGETGEENKIQWITKSVGTFTGGGGGGTGTVDTEMSDTSTNAVQNKVIKEYVDKADENVRTYLTNYAKLDSSNSFNNLQTFSEVKVNSYLDINYPDIDIIRISENTNGQLQFDFSRVGGGTTVLPSGSANNTSTIITTENIAANVAKKVDKVTGTSTYPRLYGITPTGEQQIYYTRDTETSATGGIAAYSSNNTLRTATPISDNDAANKKYVDDAVSGISLGIDVINIEYNPDTLAPVGTYDVSVFETAKKRTTKVLLTATGESYGIVCDKTLENLDETEPNLMFASGLDEAHNYYVIDMDLRDGSLIIQISKEQGQAALESGVNIKTVNGESLLGSGNITIETIKVVEISDVPAEVTNGTLTDEQLTTLQSYDGNYIMFNHEKYYLQDKGHVEGYLTYTHTGYENNQMWLKSITITIATKTWVLNVVGVKPTVVLTQSDYDNLAVKDANTLYYIIG